MSDQITKTFNNWTITPSKSCHSHWVLKDSRKEVVAVIEDGTSEVLTYNTEFNINDIETIVLELINK